LEERTLSTILLENSRKLKVHKLDYLKAERSDRDLVGTVQPGPD